MKITKFVHSCLLVEEAGKTFLFDPGNYSVEEGTLKVESIQSLDYLLITHEHQDHMFTPFIKQLVEKFPGVKIISNQAVADILKMDEIQVSTGEDELIQLEAVPHEKIFMGPAPQNVKITVAEKLTHPGDSYTFGSTASVLALPVQAPWGSTTQAVELVEKLKPQLIVPIHDWHWNDSARQNMYQRLEEYFSKIGIKFIGLKTGEVVEI